MHCLTFIVKNSFRKHILQKSSCSDSSKDVVWYDIANIWYCSTKLLINLDWVNIQLCIYCSESKKLCSSDNSQSNKKHRR